MCVKENGFSFYDSDAGGNCKHRVPFLSLLIETAIVLLQDNKPVYEEHKSYSKHSSTGHNLYNSCLINSVRDRVIKKVLNLAL